MRASVSLQLFFSFLSLFCFFSCSLGRQSAEEVSLCFGMSTDSHSARGAEKEGVGRGGEGEERNEGQKGRKVCPPLSVKAKENKAQRREQVPISGCFRTS